MKSVDLIIFDCDGVLVDSEGVLGELVEKNLASYGFHITATDFHDKFVGGTFENVFERLIAAGANLPSN